MKVRLGVAALLCFATRAQAEEECSALLAPSSVTLRDTGLEQARAACGADSIGIGTRAFALIDTPNFYGTLSASVFFDYHYLHESGFEFGAGMRILDYRFAQSAVFTDSEASFGPVHVEARKPSLRNWWGQEVVLTHAMRFELPFTNSADDNLTVAASPGIVASMLLSPSLHAHGRVSGLLWSAMPSAGPETRAAALASGDLSFAPLSPLALLGGVSVQSGWYGIGLDHVELRGGLRIAFGGHGALELSTGAVVAGSERADLAVWLGYRMRSSTGRQARPSRLQDWAM